MNALPGSLLLPDVVRRHAAERPDAPAVTGAGRTLSYADLDSSSNRMARALRARAPEPGGRIGYLSKASVESAQILLACAKSGLVSVPLNWRLSAPELAAVARDAGLAVVLAEPEFMPAATALGETLGGVPVLDMASREWVDERPDTDLGRVVDPSAVLLQIYTSGTTGLPKGVQLTLGNLAYTAEGVAAEGLAADSVVLNALPTFHIAGQGWAISALIAGGNTIMVPDFAPDELVDLLESARVTNAFMVPAMLQVLTSLPGIDERDFSALRMICYGASPITPAVLRRSMQVFGCQFAQLYGMTETSGVTTMLHPEDHDPDGPREGLLRSAGLPQPQTEIRVVDVDSGEALPAGEVGEIQTRSPYATVGYWNRPEDTAALYTEDGWLQTGDAGYLDTDGYLFISDRIKDMVITGGENVYPVEVEAVLADHPAVAEVAVIGTPDPKWGEAVTAVVVLRPGADASDAELVEFTSGRLASYKKPRIVRFVDVLPRNPSGKVLKRELRGMS